MFSSDKQHFFILLICSSLIFILIRNSIGNPISSKQQLFTTSDHLHNFISQFRAERSISSSKTSSSFWPQVQGPWIFENIFSPNNSNCSGPVPLLIFQSGGCQNFPSGISEEFQCDGDSYQTIECDSLNCQGKCNETTTNSACNQTGKGFFTTSSCNANYQFPTGYLFTTQGEFKNGSTIQQCSQMSSANSVSGVGIVTGTCLPLRGGFLIFSCNQTAASSTECSDSACSDCSSPSYISLSCATRSGHATFYNCTI